MTYQYGYDEQDLYVEEGTDRVPNDGRFHIVLRGSVIESEGNVKRALARLQQLRLNLPEVGAENEAPDLKAKMLQSEMVHRFLQQSSAEKHANRTRKGGKGR